jgi:RNA polymerase sigma-70 factor (ECF subfamily)
MTSTSTRATKVEIEEFIRTLAPELLAYFSRRTWPTEDAADCLSETLLVLWRRQADIPAIESERRAWSFGIARKVLANYRRAGQRRIALADRLRESLAVTRQSHNENTDDRVADAFARLGVNDRELLSLILWDGFGVAEAGQVLGLKAETARTRYARAKTRLRTMLT